jgi:hypothetical protein
VDVSVRVEIDTADQAVRVSRVASSRMRVTVSSESCCPRREARKHAAPSAVVEMWSPSADAPIGSVSTLHACGKKDE